MNDQITRRAWLRRSLSTYAGLAAGTKVLRSEAATPVVTVGTAKLAQAPAGRFIYGALLEHIGGQLDTMWAELLQDNSFEGFRKYSSHLENWAEGKIDARRFWWHSGYELHPWRAVGAGPSAVVRTSFGSDIMNGIHGKVVSNNSNHPAGVAQDGIPLQSGMTYHFEGYFRPLAGKGMSQSGESRVTVGLYEDTLLTRPYTRVTIPVRTPGFQKYRVELRAPETNANTTFAILAEPLGSLAIDMVSLMPADNLSGWRRDVVEALTDMGLASFRYPGGCFTSFVNWEDMVGPPVGRVPFTNLFWGGLEPNHVGTDEFLRLMELVKGEPLICVSVIGGTPERAAGWVEYCNGSERTHYGKMRARNGHPAPYEVTHWELGNEPARRFSVAQYADQCCAFSKAMKAIDSGIKLSAAAYFWSRRELELLLEKAAPSIDFLSVRTVDHKELGEFIALASRYSTSTHQLRIAATEWRNKFRKDLWIPLRIDGSARRAEAAWGYGLECARTLLEFQRRSDFVKMAMVPSVTNLFGEDLMQIGKSDIIYTTAGKVFKLLSDTRGYPLKVNVQTKPGTRLDAGAVLDEEARRLICTLVYGEPAEIRIPLDLSAWKGLLPKAKLTTLYSKNLQNMSDFRDRGLILEKKNAISGSAGVFTLELPGYSVNKLVLEIA